MDDFELEKIEGVIVTEDYYIFPGTTLTVIYKRDEYGCEEETHS